MITVERAMEMLQTLVDMGHKDAVLVFGDCNAMHKVNWIDPILVEDLDEHYLEEIAKEDNEDDLPPNAVVVG